jgi:inhibitor of cysteine peptidase
MKSKLIIIGLLAVLVLSLVACQSGEKEPATSDGEEQSVKIDPSKYAAATSVEFYTCNDFEKQKHITDNIKLTVGKLVTIILCSNQSTGFQWKEEAEISDASVVKQTKHQYIAPTGDKVGAAGQEKFTFQALKPGSATIYLEYSRPWEGGEQAEWTCTLTVDVK